MPKVNLRPINSEKPSQKPWIVQWGAVLAVFAVSMIAAVIGWQYEKNRVFENGQLQFKRDSDILREDVVETMDAYALFLRGGVGLVHASTEVTRDEWHQYVVEARLEENYPGIQGVSINGFARGAQERDLLIDHLHKRDWPEFAIKPDGERDVYTPVLFLEPLTDRNERAIGFDIYSESLRREAVDLAVVSGEPTLTAKITLVQEDEEGQPGSVQAGVLLILPTYAQGIELSSASARFDSASGLIVSVFRMGDLIESAFDARGRLPNEMIHLDLYDDNKATAQTQLFGHGADDRDAFHSQPLFTRSTTLDIYGRVWTFQMTSTPVFEASVASASPMIVLGAGILLTLLLTSLVLGQSQRTHETELAAAELTSNQEHIEFLMGEVNHRSKNLLSLVQAIARQTKADDPSQFVSQFSERVRALAANQDLLVKSGWKGISLNELIDSQLAHFDGLLGGRIQLNGPDIDICAEASQTLGMAFHELATNAGKYGALSNSVGTVDIAWQLSTDANGVECLDISWLESGGPPVVSPSQKGFGTKVTDMMVKYALDGKVESLFEPTGFVWRLSCPTERLFDISSEIASANEKAPEPFA